MRTSGHPAQDRSTALTYDQNLSYGALTDCELPVAASRLGTDRE
jgi:hypothetical protein